VRYGYGEIRAACVITLSTDFRSNPINPGGNMTAPTQNALDILRGVAPKLVELTDDVLFGDVWERTGLSKRDRSLITVATLVALYRPEQLRGHMRRAIANGVTKDELVELITHLAFYSGWPTAMSAGVIAKEIFDETK
jgi:4-carboxymuconolactone decarboxylase